MPRDDAQTDLDFRFLDTATASLLGYFVHTWFRKYLGVVSESYRRLLELGLIKGLTEPTAAGRYSMLFDFMALDMEKTSFINGIYFYLLAAHKGANHRLMNRYDGKQVLYLRGYDFEGSVATGGGMAMGFSSLDTMRFKRTSKRIASALRRVAPRLLQAHARHGSTSAFIPRSTLNDY